MLVKCIRPIFDGRNKAGPRFINLGDKVELAEGEKWPGVNMRNHFDLPEEKETTGPENVETTEAPVVERARKVTTPR